MTNDSVFFPDIAGWIYALDRASGKERWKINTHSKEFPDAHPLNCLFASPISANGKIIFDGEAFLPKQNTGVLYSFGCLATTKLVVLEWEMSEPS